MHISSLAKDCLKEELSYTVLCYNEWQTFRWSVTVELMLMVRLQSVLPLLFKMYICIHLNLTQTTGLSLAGKMKILSMNIQQVPCIWTFKLRTFKYVSVHLHVQSRKLVHVSGIYCRVPGPFAGDCAFVDCTALYGVQ